jgi:peroxiredoxin
MKDVWIVVIVLGWVAILFGAWLGWQLLRQNGRMLMRMEEIEKWLDELEFGEPYARLPNAAAETSAASDDDGRAARFGNRSLARSKINRDGLKAGTPAPDFRLPRLDGRGELSLSELLGRRVLLVFSSPSCGPCNELVPQLEEFHREHPEFELVMISKGEPKENRAKAKEQELTFPVVLQQHWEISRLYAMFATPIAYLIDESGIIIQDVAAGVEPIRALLREAAKGTSRSTAVR